MYWLWLGGWGRAQAAALQIREEAPTDPRILRGPVPQAQRVFLAIPRDPEGDDEAVLADMAFSNSRPTKSSASSEAVCHTASGAVVFPMKRRLTAFLLVARFRADAGAGTGSRRRV